MARPPSADSILRNEKKQKHSFEPKTPIATEMYLPNDSQVRGADGKLKGVYTPGSVIFADANRLLTENNSNFFWDNTNKRLGIGTASPALNLDVDGGARFGYDSGNDAYIEIRGSVNDSVIEFNKNDDTSRWEIRDDNGVLDFNEGLGGAGVLHLKTGGNVGIGITSPSALLTVNKATTAGIVEGAIINIAGLTDNNDYNGIRLGYNDSNYMKGGIFFERTGASAVGKLHFSNNGTADSSNADLTDARMTIDKDGNVGIGITSPTTQLHLTGEIQLNNNRAIRFADAAGKASDNQIYVDTSDRMNFYVNSGTKAVIDSSGNVGIGTTSPAEALTLEDGDMQLHDTATGDPFIKWSVGNTQASPTQAWVMRIDNSDGDKLQIRDTTDTRTVMTFDGTGNVGILSTSPSLPLDVNAKSGMSSIGGFCIKLTNKTGANSVQGQLVKTHAATNDAVTLAGTTEYECFGVFLEGGVSDGSEAWVVVGGIADVRFEDNHGPSIGNWVKASTTDAGDAVSQAATPGHASAHWSEIGHTIETVAAGGGGTNVLGRCVLHFN